MTTNTDPPTMRPQPRFRARLLALLSIVSAGVSHGIVTTAFAFGAPVGPTLLRRRCLYLASTAHIHSGNTDVPVTTAAYPQVRQSTRR
ncbi:MAG: hypothetical protein ABWZ98_13455 [Nakamurella sp.]